MPLNPSVFRPIRTNDVHQRPFKAYKNYRIVSPGITSGYVTQSAVFAKYRYDIGARFGDDRENADGTFEQIAWRSLKHRFYTDGGNNLPEHALNHKTERFLFLSASTLTIPYNDVGERIKPGSFELTASCGRMDHQLGVTPWSPESPMNLQYKDDGQGNLRTPHIITSSFASASRNIFHLSFNKEFERFRHGIGNIISSSLIEYNTSTQGKLKAEINNWSIKRGIRVLDSVQGSNVRSLSLNNSQGIGDVGNHPTLGMQGGVTDKNSYIRIPNDDIFKKFNRCDDWTISFFITPSTASIQNDYSIRPIITKAGVEVQGTFDARDSVVTQTDKNYALPHPTGDWSKIRTPFNIAIETTASKAIYHFQSSDGTVSSHFSASTDLFIPTGSYYNHQNHPLSESHHVVIQNSSSLCQFFINGKPTGTSGSLPPDVTNNKADVIIGNNHVGYWDILTQGTGILNSSMTLEAPGTTLHSDLTLNASLTIAAGAELTVFGNITVNSELLLEPGAVLNVYGFVDDEDLITIQDGATVRIYTESDYTFNDYDLSEIRMYDYAVNETGISSLSNRNEKSASLFQTNVVGNIFYRSGQIVLSSLVPIYNHELILDDFDNIGLNVVDAAARAHGVFDDRNANGFRAKWKGTHTIYENQVMLRLPSDLLNVTINPSATYTPTSDGTVLCNDGQRNRPPGEFRKHMFVSGTAYPYITTIGLYNDQAQLLAVGKMAQPIQKRDDVDMNFIVRWDY